MAGSLGKVDTNRSYYASSQSGNGIRSAYVYALAKGISFDLLAADFGYLAILPFKFRFCASGQ